MLLSEEPKSWGKSFISISPPFFTVVVVVVVCLNLLISDEPNTSGKSFISRAILPKVFVVVVVCLKLLLSGDSTFFFSTFISSVFVVVTGCLYLLISNEPKTSGKSFISIFPIVFVVVVVVVCAGLSPVPVVFVVVVVVVCLKLAIFEEPKVSGKSSISNSILVIFIWFKLSVLGCSSDFLTSVVAFSSLLASAGPAFWKYLSKFSWAETCKFAEAFILAGRLDWLTEVEFVCLKYLLISSFEGICFTAVTLVTFVWVGKLSCCTNLSKFKPPGTWTLALFASCFISTKEVDSFSVE